MLSEIAGSLAGLSGMLGGGFSVPVGAVKEFVGADEVEDRPLM